MDFAKLEAMVRKLFPDVELEQAVSPWMGIVQAEDVPLVKATLLLLGCEEIAGNIYSYLGTIVLCHSTPWTSGGAKLYGTGLEDCLFQRRLIEERENIKWSQPKAR